MLIIYGPPAAGKLTVAREIARKTNFRLFHNHLSIDVVRDIFDDRGIRGKVIEKIRGDVIESAAQAGVNLIFTVVYEVGADDNYIANTMASAENSGGEVCLVQLTPSRAELERRVVAESRQKFSKLKTSAALGEVLENHELYGKVPHRETLQIDNSSLAVSDVADEIIHHYHLSR